jgi:F0F1-type ATP synthase membrane subunit b/b'
MAVAEFASQAGTERDDAVRRAKELEAQLEILKKESQDALAQAKADAQKLEEERHTRAAERKEQLAGRLRVMADALSSMLLEHEPAVLVMLPL